MPRNYTIREDRRPRISPEHIAWAYDVHLRDLRRQGMSIEAIRKHMREEWHLHVGTEAIKAVLLSFPEFRR